MRMRLPGLCLCLLLLSCLPARRLAASSSKDIEAKVSLESSLEKRLLGVLKEVIGTDDVIVIVNVMLIPEDERTDELMPGVRPKTTPAVPATLELTLNLVRRVSATVIVDESLGEKDVALVRETASGILGISPQRGDTLKIDKMKFNKAAAAAPPHAPVTIYSLLNSTLGVTAMWLLLVVGLAVGGFTLFLKPLLLLLRETGARLKEPPGAPPRREEEPAAAEALDRPILSQQLAGAHPGNGNGKAEGPFSFLAPEDLWGVVYLMRDAAAKDVAMVAHYAPRATASRLLESLPVQKRQQVIGLLTHIQQLDEKEVSAVEGRLRKHLQFLVGGEDKLAEVLDALPPSLQSEAVATLQARDPALAQRLRQRVVFLEDLLVLDPSEIKLLARRVPARLLASVLKASPRLKESLLPKLASGMRAWIEQEIELSPSLPMPQVEENCRRILDALRQLSREGRIRPHKQGT